MMKFVYLSIIRNLLIKINPISVINTIGAMSLRNNLCCFVASRTGPATAINI